MSGRKPLGPRLVEQLEGSEQAKLRLAVILETIAGTSTIEDASTRLGIRPAQLHNLRRRVLEAGLADLEPRPRGRRPREVDRRDLQLGELAQRIAELEQELQLADVRRQLETLVLPATNDDDDVKKTTHRRKTRLQKQRRQKKRKRHPRPPK